mgnify:CR=1 FL=1
MTVENEEIGDIGWYTYYETIDRLRPYHTERIRLLSEVYMFIMNMLIHTNNKNNHTRHHNKHARPWLKLW